MAGLIDPIEAISIVIKAGMAIHDRYKAYSHATVDLQKLEAHLDGSLFVLEAFQEYIENNLPCLRPYQQMQIINLVDQLQGVFDRLDKQISRLPANEKFDFVKKLRWSFGGKSGYEAIIQEMKDWRTDLNDVITAIKLLQEKRTDISSSPKGGISSRRLFELAGNGLRQAAIMEDVLYSRNYDRYPPGDLIRHDASELTELQSISKISQTSRDRAEIVQLYFQGTYHLLFAEYRGCLSDPEKTRRNESAEDVLKLGDILNHTEPSSMHIPRCVGSVYMEASRECLLLYSLPSKTTYQVGNLKLVTLTQVMSDEALKPTLEVRVRYAREIAKAVMFTHAAGLVHKTICPESILILPTVDGPHVKYSAFLVGYDAAGLVDMSAYRDTFSPLDPMKTPYMHPERQLEGGKTVITSGMRHDMYSLGVVLLEIGMWKPVHRMNKALQEVCDRRSFNTDIVRLREYLLDEATNHLASETGSIYASVVLCCLNRTAPQYLNEEEVKEVFYERVMQKLHQIVV